MSEQMFKQNTEKGIIENPTNYLEGKKLGTLMEEGRLVLEGDDKILIQQYCDALRKHASIDLQENTPTIAVELLELTADLARKFAGLNGMDVSLSKSTIM